MEKLRQESHMDSFTLLQATQEDCELMFRLQKLDGAQLDRENVDLMARFEEYQSNFNPAEIQVVCVGNELVGRLRIERGEEIYIGGLQILPEYRGRGIGTALLEGLVAESNDLIKPIRLEVFHNNQTALALYEKMGFKVVEENEQQKIMCYEPR